MAASSPRTKFRILCSKHSVGTGAGSGVPTYPMGGANAPAKEDREVGDRVDGLFRVDDDDPPLAGSVGKRLLLRNLLTEDLTGGL